MVSCKNVLNIWSKIIYLEFTWTYYWGLCQKLATYIKLKCIISKLFNKRKPAPYLRWYRRKVSYHHSIWHHFRLIISIYNLFIFVRKCLDWVGRVNALNFYKIIPKYNVSLILAITLPFLCLPVCLDVNVGESRAEG